MEIIAVVVLFLLGLLSQITLALYLSGRADRADKRLADAVNEVNHTEQQRHLDSLRVHRAAALREVEVASVAVLPLLDEVLSGALRRPVHIQSTLSVSVSPVPAVVFDTGKEEIVVTTSADAYIEQVLTPARRLVKGERPESVSILPGLDRLVVDEELYQCFAHLAAQFHVDVSAVQRVPIWHVIVLAENPKPQK